MRQRATFCVAYVLTLLPMVAFAAQRPQLQIQTGHVGSTAVYSPNGRIIANSSSDSTVKLLDAATGKQLRTLTSLNASVTALCFTRDGALLAGGDYAGNVVIWNVQDGVALHVIANGITIYDLAFSADGRSLAGVSERTTTGSVDEHRLSVWDVASGQVTRTWQLAKSSSAVLFSPDGQTVVTGGGDPNNNINFWNVATGALSKSLAGHTKRIVSLGFSADGRMLASSSSDFSVKVWDVAGGSVRQTIVEQYAQFYSAAFSPDGQMLVTVSDKSDGRVKVWRVADGQLLATLHDFTGSVFSATFRPDNRTIVSATGKDGITFHDARNGQKIGAFEAASKGGFNAVAGMSSSANGRTLATARRSGGIEVWDLVNSTMRVYGKDLPKGFTSVAISADGRLLAGGSLDEKLFLWDTATGELRHTFNSLNGLRPVLFSRDGRLLFNGLQDGDVKVVKVWDTATGAEMATLTGLNSYATQLALSPDGQTLAVGTMHFKDNVLLFNVKDGTLLRTLTGHKNAISALTFSPDGRILVSGSLDDTLRVWNVADGAPLRSLTRQHERPSLRWATALMFSPDGKILAGGFLDDSITLWDAATWGELRTLSGHSGAIDALVFSPDGSKLSSGSEDTTIKVWNAGTGAELCTMIGGGSAADDWLVVTPDGLFDGTPVAWRNLDWRFSPALYDLSPVELFFNEFYYPNLLGDVMAGRRIKAAQDIAQKDRRQPRVSLAMAANGGAGAAASTTPSVGVQIRISDAPAGAQDVRLFRNGSLVHVWHGDVLQGKGEATLTANVPVIAGKNLFTAYAFNRDNVKSSDATLMVSGAESLRRKGVAYVLSVGVNAYANHDFDLKYAVADAKDFGSEWQAQQTRLQTYERTEITSLTDARATKPAIIKFLADLAGKAKPEDAVVIYFAGHGTAQANRFYLIPHDLGYAGGRDAIDEEGLKTILDHSISDLELQAAIETIDAGQLLMVIDACNSGQALESEEKRRGPMNSKGLAQLAYEKGMYILTAAQSYQAAQEASKFGHGFLTYALVEEGIKQSKADDEPKDGQVVAREWFDYATQRVPQMQVELMKEAQGGRGVTVAFVKGEEQIADPAARNVQRPRVFYRRELEAQPLVVARPGEQ